MVEQARRGMPTPPIALPQGAAEVRARFDGRAVPVDDAVLERLGQVCARVDTAPEARVEAGRDWWPVTVGWALDGEVPARAAAVACPATAAEVAAVLAVCHHARVPVTVIGGRSGVGGHAVPVFGGVQLDMTGLRGITAVDEESLLVDVAAGTFGDVLEEELRDRHRLTLGHWPQSMALSTVGGWIACRSAGQYSTRYGKIEDMVVGLDVALADGRVITTGGTAPRSATGPDLTQLFVGSEGTLGAVTEARLRVHPVPPAELRAAFGFDTFAAGVLACRTMLRRGARPAVVRLYDQRESGSAFESPGTNVLILLDEGDEALVDATMAVASVAYTSAGGRPLDAGLVGRWWDRRQDVSALEEAVRAGLTVDTIEVAGRWSVLPTLYREVHDAVAAIHGTFVVSAHLSHAYGDGGCLYFTFAGQPAATPDQSRSSGEAYYRRVWDEVMARTVALGGAISHHHGIGLNRGRHLATALGPAYDLLLAVKQALDPHGVLNPGKLGLPSPFGQAPWP